MSCYICNDSLNEKTVEFPCCTTKAHSVCFLETAALNAYVLQPIICMCSTVLWSPPYSEPDESVVANEEVSNNYIEDAKVVKKHISKFKKTKKATTATLHAAFTEFKPHIDSFKAAHKAVTRMVRQTPAFKEGLREFNNMWRALDIFKEKWKWSHIHLRRNFKLHLLRNPLSMLKRKFRIRV